MRAAIAGVSLTLATVAAALPHCPTEDSCEADYHHKSWHIIKIDN